MTWSMARPWRGPCRGTAAGSRHSSCRVRAGSPPPVRADGIGDTSSSLYVVLCTLYRAMSLFRRLPGVSMKITASAVSLNVDDVAASARFLTTHFGFTEEMSADGFVSLARQDAGMNVVFLRRGMDMLPEDQRHDHACGLILAFEVDDLDGELARLQAEGVAVTMPLRSE